MLGLVRGRRGDAPAATRRQKNEVGVELDADRGVRNRDHLLVDFLTRSCADHFLTATGTDRSSQVGDSVARKLRNEEFTAGSRVDGIAPEEAAAWTAVARVLMNLDEFITRE